jgi:hypothetical protein
MKILAWCLLAGILLADSIECFQKMVIPFRKSYSESQPLWSLPSRPDSPDEEETDADVSGGIPQLPAFGSSSFSNPTLVNDNASLPSFGLAGENISGTAFASPKFKLQYTCNVCDTRNSHMVSRVGKMVILKCFVFETPINLV